MTVTKHDRDIVKFVRKNLDLRDRGEIQLLCGEIAPESYCILCRMCPVPSCTLGCTSRLEEWYYAKLIEIELEDLLEEKLSDDSN